MRVLGYIMKTFLQINLVSGYHENFQAISMQPHHRDEPGSMALPGQGLSKLESSSHQSEACVTHQGHRPATWGLGFTHAPDLKLKETVLLQSHLRVTLITCLSQIYTKQSFLM